MMAKQRIAHTNKVYPLGGSPSFFDRQDELREAEADDDYADDVPALEVLPSVKESPAYKALERLIEQLRQQVTQLAEENRQLKQGQPTADTAEKKPREYKHGKPGPARAESIIKIGESVWWSLSHVAEVRGIDQSTVSRKLHKADGIPVKIRGGVKYIPAAQAENFKNEAKRKR